MDFNGKFIDLPYTDFINPDLKGIYSQGPALSIDAPGQMGLIVILLKNMASPGININCDWCPPDREDRTVFQIVHSVVFHFAE